MRPLSFFEKFILSISALFGYFKLLGLQKKKEKLERKLYLKELKEQKIEEKIHNRIYNKDGSHKSPKTHYERNIKIFFGLMTIMALIAIILAVVFIPITPQLMPSSQEQPNTGNWRVASTPAYPDNLQQIQFHSFNEIPDTHNFMTIVNYNTGRKHRIEGCPSPRDIERITQIKSGDTIYIRPSWRGNIEEIYDINHNLIYKQH